MMSYSLDLNNLFFVEEMVQFCLKPFFFFLNFILEFSILRCPGY